MKKIISLSIVLFFFYPVLRAQKLDDRKKIQAALNKDTGYKRFAKQLNELRKTTHGNYTNAAAVKALFTRNKTMLTRVYTANNITGGQHPLMTAARSQLFNLKEKMKMAGQPGFPHVPPYADHWVGRVMDQMDGIFDAGSDTSIGKLAYGYAAQEYIQRLSNSSAGFMEKIRIPSDPDIVAARVEFQYSFHFTGWDTKDAHFRIGLVLQCVEFTSVPFLDLPPLVEMNMPPDNKWRRVSELTPEINIDEDAREFTYDVDTSFVIEGNVVPGRDMIFRIGVGYRQGDIEGIYTCYHYGEFRLKKIKVSYMKTN